MLFRSNKVIMNPSAGSASNNNNQNTTMQSMNAMNNIMPFVSGAFCFMFPIGVGLYWVAGNIFRTVQGVFINMYFNKVGLDNLIEKNREKQIKKQEKKGIDVNSTRMQEITKQKTSSVSSIAKPTNNSSKRILPAARKTQRIFILTRISKMEVYLILQTCLIVIIANLMMSNLKTVQMNRRIIICQSGWNSPVRQLKTP